MNKTMEIMILVMGIIALLFMNSIAIIFNAEWINTAMVMDGAFIGALITKFLNGRR